MKKTFEHISVYVILLLLVTKISFAQSTEVITASKSEIIQTPCAGSTQLQGVDPAWMVMINHKPIKHPTTDQDQELVDRIKAEKQLLRQKLLSSIPTPEPEALQATPVKGTNFQGNTNSGWTPLDNSVAISNGGYIVSVTNSNIKMYNTSGTSLYTNTLAGFINIPTITSAFDPHVLYDNVSNRFILVTLSGTTPTTSRLLVCFSKTSNPVTGGWWVYNLNGDVLSNSKWFDYPKIAVTNGELFISGNMFSNLNIFDQSVILQLNKTQGYNGASMSSVTWSNITGTPGSILPIGHGHGSSYGPGCFFISTNSASGSTVKLYKISNILTANPVMTYNSIPTSNYSAAGDASQSGSTDLLDVGDCRALSGFYLSGIIHFVHNVDKGSGFCGVRYHRITVGSLKDVRTTLTGSSTTDYAYGSIASFTNSTADKSVMIGYQAVNAGIFPSLYVRNVDNSFVWSSQLNIKSGGGYVNFQTSTTERWGDYSGIARKHNSSTPSIWMSGAYGTTAHNWSTWISEVHTTSPRIGLTADEQPVDAVKVFPQPVAETFSLEFTMAKEQELLLSLFDEKGALVKELYKGMAAEGINILSFNKNNLSVGTYLLLGTDTENNAVIREKIIVAN